MRKTTAFILFSSLVLAYSLTLTANDGDYVSKWGERKPPVHPKTLPVFEINADLPFEERWNEVIKAKKEPLHAFLKHILIKYIPTGWLDYLTYPLAKRYNEEYAHELKVFSDLAEIPFSDVFLLNFMYEIAAACSGVIVQDNHGNVLVGRTLDFGTSQYIAALAFHAKYYKGGKLLYESVDLAGFRGLVTASKSKTFTFSINEYHVENNLSFEGIARHFKMIYTYLSRIAMKKLPAPYVARQAFETEKDYDGLVKRLIDTDSISRAHYVVTGPKKGQGVVITKFEDKLETLASLDAENGRWFVVQTNYQRDVPDPKKDNRRTAAEDRLNKLGRNSINKETLFEEIMNVYPTFNAHTVHTTITQVNEGYFNSTLWF